MRQGAEAYVIPNGHDQDHGHGPDGVELVPATDLGEAVTVAEGGNLSGAVLGGDATAVGGEAVEFGGGNLDLLAALDEELSDLVVGELGDDATRKRY